MPFRRANSERASDVLLTQRDAIERARELSRAARPTCRVRNTSGGSPDSRRQGVIEKLTWMKEANGGFFEKGLIL